MNPKLFTPGPTRVPESLLKRMAEPIIHHRSSAFKAELEQLQPKLQKIFRTSQPVLVLSSSGTGAMEASVANCFSPGDRVLVINAGKFGERWREIAKVYGLLVDEVVVPWGEGVAIDRVRRALENNSIRGVLVQASETCTGVKHPIQEIAQLTRTRDTLLVVDAITATGVFDVRMDEWGIDLLITGSQKGLMLPPGLALISLSSRAWAWAEKSTLPKFYFDLRKELKNQKKFQTAFTPAVPLVIGLNAALDMIENEGLENVFARHNQLLSTCRIAAETLGLKLAARSSPSPACSPIFFPDGFPGKEFLTHMKTKYQCFFASGQGDWEGKIFRIGHMGYFFMSDLREGFEALIAGFQDFNRPLTNAAKAVAMIRELE